MIRCRGILPGIRLSRPHARRQQHVASANKLAEDRQLKDVFPESLDATLEAHRASNVASLIHRHESKKGQHASSYRTYNAKTSSWPWEEAASSGKANEALVIRRYQTEETPHQTEAALRVRATIERKEAASSGKASEALVIRRYQHEETPYRTEAAVRVRAATERVEARAKWTKEQHADRTPFDRHAESEKSTSRTSKLVDKAGVVEKSKDSLQVPIRRQKVLEAHDEESKASPKNPIRRAKFLKAHGESGDSRSQQSAMFSQSPLTLKDPALRAFGAYIAPISIFDPATPNLNRAPHLDVDEIKQEFDASKRFV